MGRKPVDGVVVIKKYANRRLYDTQSSIYVTLEDLYEMVKRGEDFIVKDAKTDEDLTRTILTQIIFEQESKGYNLLPVSFLRQIIGFYGDNLGAVLPSYLEKSMDNFLDNQEKIRSYLGSFTEFPGLDNFNKFGNNIGNQNVDIFEQTMNNMFSLMGWGSSEKKKDD